MRRPLATARQVALARARRAAAPPAKRKPRREEAPKASWPKAAEKDLYHQLDRAGERMAEAVRAMIPDLVNRLELEQGAVRVDAEITPPDQIARALEGAVNMAALEAGARAVAGAVDKHQRRELTKQLEAVVGADVSTSDPTLPRLIDQFAAEQATQIKGLTSETAARVSKLVAASVSAGRTPEELRRALGEIADLTPKRARNVARDQTGKLYGAINKARQTELGVESYIWDCVNDQRVRGRPGGRYPNASPSHWARNGKEYRWDKPPSDGHPGAAVNCRCSARPVLRKLLLEPDEEVTQGAAGPTPEQLARAQVEREVERSLAEARSRAKAATAAHAAAKVEREAQKLLSEMIRDPLAPNDMYSPAARRLAEQRYQQIIESLEPTPEFTINRIGVEAVRETPHRTIEVVSEPAFSFGRIGVHSPAPFEVTPEEEPLKGPYGPLPDDDGARRMIALLSDPSNKVQENERGEVIDPLTGLPFSRQAQVAARQALIDLEYERTKAEQKRQKELGVLGRAREKIGNLFRRKR